jgi:hypothetical protein
MDSEAELRAALSEWRRLAEAVGKAIREGNWSFVAECQSAISQLRPALDRVTGQNRQNSESPTSAPPGAARKATARAIVLDLIELEKRNLASIQERREKLAAHVAQLGRTNRNLRGIQRSYAPPLPSAWNSYS